MKSLIVFSVLFQISIACTLDKSDLFCTSFNELKKNENYGMVRSYNVLEKADHVIKKEDFSRLPEITNFVAKGQNKNKFTVDKDAFKDLKKIKTVEFADCIVPKLEVGTFDNTPVEVISFVNAGLKDIPQNLFSKMAKAYQAWINKNKIPHLKKGIFTNTNFNLLYLCSNEITTLDPEAFYGMKNLGYLNLEGNKLASFRPERYIGKSLSLEQLILGQNQITTVKKFPEMPKLTLLKLEENAIKSFEDHAFDNLKNIYTVILSNNKIEELRSNVFPKDCSIEELFLDNNKLKYIQPNALQKLSKLRNVTVDGNPWTCPCQLALKSWFEQHKVIVSDMPDQKIKDCKKEKSAQCVYQH